MTQRQLQRLYEAVVEGASAAQIKVLAMQLLTTTAETEFIARTQACMALAGPAGDEMTTPVDERLVWARTAEEIAREAARAGRGEYAWSLLTRAYLLHGDILREMGDIAGVWSRTNEAHSASTIAAGGKELRVRIQLVRGRAELSAAQENADGLLTSAAEYFQWSYDHMVDDDPESMTPEQANLWAIVLCHHAFIQYLVGDPYVADAVMWKFRAAADRLPHPMIRRAANDLGPLLWGNRPDGQYMSTAEFSEFMLRELYHP